MINRSVFFGFAVADSMFPENCTVSRLGLTPEQAMGQIRGATDNGTLVSCLNPSHLATIQAMSTRYRISIAIPTTAPQVKLAVGDQVIVMSVRGLPRLDATRHEYTAEEIEKASFVFGLWSVVSI